MNNELRTMNWEEDQLMLLDQTRLPNDIVYEQHDSIESIWKAIQMMKVRGAPAIGVAAAYGVYLGVKESQASSFTAFMEELNECTDCLATSRPTAVNLFWALDRMKRTARAWNNVPVETIKANLLKEAQHIHKEDEQTNKKIGKHALNLLHDGMGILTHCNAGALATTKYGTATSPIYLAHEQGWDLKVYANETRPRLQGSMLTAMELQLAEIDVTVITDSMDSVILSQGKIDAIIVGADRVAANGDVANKVGTLGLSILAQYYNVPFYVAAPTSTIDMNMKSGADIPIEKRDPMEVIHGFGTWTALKDSQVYNPAFDVTPSKNVTAIITEKGIINNPNEANVKAIFK